MSGRAPAAGPISERIEALANTLNTLDPVEWIQLAIRLEDTAAALAHGAVLGKMLERFGARAARKLALDCVEDNLPESAAEVPS